MPNPFDFASKVPLMYRAQVAGRCQLQRLIPKAPVQEANLWADEWVDKAYPDAPSFGEEVQTGTYSISWRFITNGGQDDGVIRPVIGAKGWPFYPGSSMKGVFRQACQAMEQAGELTAGTCDRYCGGKADLSPGILRFHGGYPTDSRWTENLVDIVHPQQDWQVKSSRSSSAFIQMSLHKPELRFGISSTVDLGAEAWQQVWQIWERGLSLGIGCRVSAGYGQPEKHTGEILYRTQLKGQGQAAKLVDNTGEFRPNIFKAAVRGHALRLFGGLTDAASAEGLVEDLFGGISRGSATVGLLSMAFQTLSLELSKFGQGSYAQPTYEVEGELVWLVTRALPAEQKAGLIKLIRALTRFAMVMGGFGKSWRRADHRLVYPDYYDDGRKPLIGCHWQWLGTAAQLNDVKVRRPEHLPLFIEEVRQAVQDWMTLQGVRVTPSRHADWREAWHPDTVQVWGRTARFLQDSEAVGWLHGPYRNALRAANITEGSIYKSSLTGQMGQIGRLWHRLYPAVRVSKDPNNPQQQPQPKVVAQHFEWLTLFPDNSRESRAFIDFLNHEQQEFKQLWPRS